VTTNIDRRKFLAAAGSGAAALVAGCSGGGSEDTATETEGDDTGGGDDGTATETDDMSTEDSTGGTLQLSLFQQEVLDPVAVKGKNSGGASWQLFEPVVAFKNGTLPPENRLIEDVQVNDDGTVWTFTVRDDVVFHDGSELTAGDVAYSYKRLAGSENNRGNEGKIIGFTFTVAHETDDDGNYVPGSLAVEATDDRTVEMELASPFHSVLAILADINFCIVPEGIVGDVEGYEGEMSYQQFANEELIGTGPFAFENWDQGSEITATAFEDYHDAVPNVDGVRWNISSDSNTLYNRAMNENLDFFDIPLAQYDPDLLSIEEELDGARRRGTYGPVRNGETLNYGEVTLLRTNYLLFNTLEVPRAVRQAFAYVVNQEALIEDTTKGQGTPAYHITPPVAYPGGKDAYDAHVEDYPYGVGETDIEGARSVMQEAGYGEDNRYEVTFTAYSDSDASFWGDVAARTRDKLASAYVDVEIERAPATTVTNRAIEGSFEMFGTFNELEWVEADSTLRFVYPNPFTWTRWGQGEEVSDPAQEAADAWSRYQNNRAPTEDAQQVRNDVYVTLEEANWQDITELPLVHPIATRYSYDSVENLEMHGAMFNQLYNRLELDR